MTKEQAIKHGKVIRWWIKNPDYGTWWNGASDWKLTVKPDFNLNCYYVQNDEYADFRMALADGEKLQFKTNDNDETEWKDLNELEPTDEFDDKLKYRIKSDEQKFKIGDWYWDHHVLKNLQINELNIDNINNSEFKKWKPKDKELCVFWNVDEYCVEYHIGYYGEECSADLEQDYFNKDDWDNIAPFEFINTLKG